MYYDEATPGNSVKGNDRKSQAVYWRPLNFGSLILSCEEARFTVASMQSSTAKQVQGGMSQL